MKRWLPALLPLLLFAKPTAEIPCPAQPPAICEPWLTFSDETVSVCVDEEALTIMSDHGVR